MNKVILIGYLTKNPEVRYSTKDTSLQITRYTIAVNRRFKKDDISADFINCVSFGKQAEFAERYFYKGIKIVVIGRLQVSSYINKDNIKIYTTDVIIEEQEFAESKAVNDNRRNNINDKKNKNTSNNNNNITMSDDNEFMNIPDDGIDEDLPFD